MSERFYQITSGAIVVAILAGVIYFSSRENKEGTTPVVNNPEEIVATTTPNDSDIEYLNSEYFFSISLPESWEGYTVIEDEWEGFTLNASGESQIVIESGPLVSIRHPDWEYKSPRQDIPIMVFTILQWNSMQNDKFHIGAAPVNPSELGRNKNYVFALPARYNFAFLVGFEEVEAILKGGSFKAL